MIVKLKSAKLIHRRLTGSRDVNFHEQAGTFSLVQASIRLYVCSRN